VFVRAVAGAGGKWQVSTDGGIEPVWGRTGTELFYRAGDTMMSVAISSGSTFSFERPRRLFEGSFLFGTTEGQEYDVAPDGKRFLMMQPTTGNRTVTPLEVVLDWREELEQRFATTR
jgi:hypothetical protein